MTINKSIIEEFELENGSAFYVQISSLGSNNATISFDGPVANFSISIKAEELADLRNVIDKVIGEYDGNI